MPRRPSARRRLVPVGLLVGAAIAGLLAGLLNALADGAPTLPAAATRTVDAPLATGPLRTALPDVAAFGPGDRLPVVAPARRGRNARVVARVADPYGGPDWAVRTFVARSLRFSDVRLPRRVAQTCAQVGRIIDGAFVWIHPHRPRAFAVPVDTTTTTVCTGRSRAVVLGALRLPTAADPGSNPKISATVVWGLSPQPRTRVALRFPDDALDLPALRHGVRLRVVRGDLDIGRRTAIADGTPVDGGVDNASTACRASRAVRPPAGDRSASRLDSGCRDRRRSVLRSSDARGDGARTRVGRPLLGGSRSRGGREPVRTAGATRALAPSQALCQTAFDVPPGRWTLLNGGASSNGGERVAERRRLRERRTLAGSSSQAWAFPREITEVDIEDPLGVRTIRTVPLGGISIVYVQRAGDVAVGVFGFFGGEERRVFTGRKADGTEVVLRHWRPR